MRQEFYQTTLVSKFIKYLLSYTPLPIYKFIFDNEDMVSGCLYTYKDKILKCTKSGRFLGINGTRGIVDHLRAQEQLRSEDPFYSTYGADNQNLKQSEWEKYIPKESESTEGWMTVMHPDQGSGEYIAQVRPLSVTDNVVSINTIQIAEFDIVDSFLPGSYKPGVTQKYVSTVNYYDQETHRWLGEYLRYLSNMYDLDLMPLYNCFTYKTTQSFQLRRTGVGNIYDKPTSKYKLILVPIKYGKTYTIAIECDFPVLMKSVFYNDTLVRDPDDQNYLTNYIDETLTIHNNMQFSRPVTYTLTNKQLQNGDVNLYKYEKYLYLAIQLPVNNDSSIVVLEGDYSQNGMSVIADIKGIEDKSTHELSKMMISRLTLLHDNDRKQHPFSEKLIQYLLRNTIDTREYIDDNVANIEKKIGYYPQYQGQWDSTLRYILYSKYMGMRSRAELNYQDILGYVDSDIENAVRKGYIISD